MEVVNASRTLVRIDMITGWHIPEGSNLHVSAVMCIQNPSQDMISVLISAYCYHLLSLQISVNSDIPIPLCCKYILNEIVQFPETQLEWVSIVYFLIATEFHFSTNPSENPN